MADGHAMPRGGGVRTRGIALALGTVMAAAACTGSGAPSDEPSAGGPRVASPSPREIVRAPREIRPSPPAVDPDQRGKLADPPGGFLETSWLMRNTGDRAISFAVGRDASGDWIADVRRFDAAMDPDPSFGDGGYVRWSIGAPNAVPFIGDVKRHHRGDNALFVVAGSTLDGRTTFKVYRMSPDGTLDRSYDREQQDGFVFDIVGDTRPRLGLTADGRARVCYHDGKTRMLTLTPGGGIDPTAGADGVRTFDVAGLSGCDAFAVDAEGRMMILGGRERISLVRVLPDATLDTSFGNDGVARIRLEGWWMRPRQIALPDDGTIYVTGESYPIRAGDVIDFADPHWLIGHVDQQGRATGRLGGDGLIFFVSDVLIDDVPLDLTAGGMIAAGPAGPLPEYNGGTPMTSLGLVRPDSGRLDRSFGERGLLWFNGIAARAMPSEERALLVLRHRVAPDGAIIASLDRFRS